MLNICSGGAWRIIVAQRNNKISVLHAESGSEINRLPDELFGLPVTELGDRALAPTAPPADGDEVFVNCSAQSFAGRDLRELTLPEGLEATGKYCFMNCRSLNKLIIGGKINSFGTGSFVNCRSLENIEILCDDIYATETAAYIASAMSHQLNISMTDKPGRRIKLVFPEYYEEYVENSPAHHFDYKIDGEGYRYRLTFKNRHISPYEYDACWNDYISTNSDEKTALYIACNRVCFPEGLSDRAKSEYTDYIASHMSEALSYFIDRRDREGLDAMLKIQPADVNVYRAALEESRRIGWTEASALLLEKVHMGGQTKRKSFEL